MNQPSPGPQDGVNASGTAPTAQTGNRAGTQQHQTVLGPFTVRDLTVFASTIILFIASLLPMFGGRNLWNLNNLFVLGLGIILPLVVTALFVARRLQPASVIRIGSLSIDQFASVAASFAIALFFLTTAASFSASMLFGLVGALGLFAATVIAPHLPYLSADFKDRAEAPAHVVARNAAVPVRKPASPKAPKSAAPAQPAGESGPAPAGFGATAGSSGPGRSAGVPSTSAFAAAPSAESFPATQAAAVVPPAGAPQAPEGEGPATHAAVAHAAEASAEPQSTVSAPDAAPEGDTQQPETRKADTQHAEAAPAETQQPETASEEAPYTGSADTQAAHATATDAGSPAHVAETMPPTMASPAVAPAGSARRASFDATVDPTSRPEESDHEPSYEAFWFAVPQPRTVVDEHTGAPVFTIEPGGWVLALEDRGDEILVQHTDGRVGILRDLSHIERG